MRSARGCLPTSEARATRRSAPGDGGVVGPAPRGAVEQGESGDDAVEVGDHRRPQSFEIRPLAAQRTGEAVVVTDGPQIGVEAVGAQQIDARASRNSWYRPVVTLVHRHLTIVR